MTGIIELRRRMHPECQEKPSIPPGNVHPRQGRPRPWPDRHCPCEAGLPCFIHDPVVAEGDWDA